MIIDGENVSYQINGTNLGVAFKIPNVQNCKPAVFIVDVPDVVNLIGGSLTTFGLSS